jgi:hypothetical protein
METQRGHEPQDDVPAHRRFAADSVINVACFGPGVVTRSHFATRISKRRNGHGTFVCGTRFSR